MREPPEINYLRALMDQWRDKARDRGSITLEWMVIIGLVFAAALVAATKIVNAIRAHSDQIK